MRVRLIQDYSTIEMLGNGEGMYTDFKTGRKQEE